jgi:hypothetical protein
LPIVDCRLLIENGGSGHATLSIANRQSAIGNENLLPGCLECLVNVGDDVFDILEADRKPDVILRHACLKLFRRSQLLVRGAGGVDDQGLGIPNVG